MHKMIHYQKMRGDDKVYFNSGYLHNSRIAFKDKSRPLIVGSCGTYRLRTIEKLPTWWKNGRVDWQLLYVASGKTHFYIKGEDVVVTAGHMVLFQPKQVQHYEYFGKDKPEVYWVHFTGSDVKNILRKHQIPLDKNVFYCGSSSTYAYLYKEIISELQSCRVGYEELISMYLRQIFLLIQRSREERTPTVSTYIQEEMELARRHFNEHYNEEINIEDYALSRNMSVSWFIRNFKQVTMKSPMQYILGVRIGNAVSLLESTDYNVTEISAIVGYDNPLYFSRIFKKQKGLSPSDYRKKLKERYEDK